MMTEAPLKVEFICYRIVGRMPKSDKPLWFYFPHRGRWVLCSKWERSDGKLEPKNRTFFWPVERSNEGFFSTKNRPTFYAHDIPEPNIPEGITE